MDKEKTAVVLGGTVPHIELIRQLKGRGYRTVLVDYLADPPAKAEADEHVRESTLEQEKVLAISKDRKAELVISACVDQANITACYVMEQLGLRPPYSYKTALMITNKGWMKQRMLESGIPTSKYLYVDSSKGVSLTGMKYPVMVKPADSNSANGVKKAYNEAEVQEYLKQALRISRNGRAIIEEYVQGTEISAYCFVEENCAKLLMTAERFSVVEDADNVIKCYASLAPARLSEKAKKKVAETADKIAFTFALRNTPMFFQAIIKDDEVYVIELAPRTGGGISYKTILENTGFDIISASIDSYLGLPVRVDSHAPRYLYAVNTVYGLDGIFDHMSGADWLMDNGIIEAVYYHKTKGMVLDNRRASSSRVGAFITKAFCEEEMREKVLQAFEKLEVYDSNGRKIIRRDLNIADKDICRPGGKFHAPSSI